jgi:septal ring factor EnvC (AmiA/AmiB activator)
MSDYWFHKKWGIQPQIPMEELFKKIEMLEEKVSKLEEENVETTNLLYELSNSIEAVDRRIDIIADDWGQQFNV